MMDSPTIISSDDHVVEAPDLWESRLPTKFREQGPRLERGPGVRWSLVGGEDVFTKSDDFPPCDYWIFGDIRMPVTNSFADASLSDENRHLSGDTADEQTVGITYEEMRPGFYQPKARLADMDLNRVHASVCYPNLIPRFAGQTFLEAADKELALLCVQAYNDWGVEEWGGDSNGRLIPICITPLWDAQLAATEVYRNAARGVRAMTFTELPANLGLPSIHDKNGYWDPFFHACNETNMVIAMHIGSSGVPSSSPDAPTAVSSAACFTYAQLSMADWLFSGIFERFPNIKIMYSEAEIGWIPALLERADRKWEESPGYYNRQLVKRPPSDYYRNHVFGCIITDRHGLANIEAVGEDNVLFEVDYPHKATSWPNSLAIAEKEFAGLTDAQREKIFRGNAAKLFRLDV
jgi:predicted TIM-barrel fold metal-dependent hydrolase